ncbi:MAG: ABC transporter permease subunit [Chitinophagaceae bacterium]|nr:MAG: ABC transporter permease subunit [Chitinophagaceae bacterium]
MKQQGFWEFIVEQHQKILAQVVEHLSLTFISLLLAVMIGIPVGIIISRRKKMANAVLGIAGVLQTVPSIALLGFMIPAFGIGITPAIIALLIYALLPVIRNTYTGITGVSPAITEAAKAVGMSRYQVLYKVEIPLAMPVILAGVRTAAVINVGVATLASFVAAGGLGEFIFGGISLNNTNMILAGAIPAAFLAIFLDQLIGLAQRTRFAMPGKTLLVVPAVALLVIFITIFTRAKGNEFKAGFTPEFMGRQDGDLGLRSVYGLKVNPLVVSDAIMYKALQDGELDLISGYSTDGRIMAFNLSVLEDDKHIFPPYYAAPVIRTQTLLKFPALEKVLNLLAGQINDSAMTDLNYRTDILNQTPATVAREFLERKGLYRPPGSGGGGTIRVGSKIFGEQYILAEMYKLLIEGHTSYSVTTKTGLGGTKICFDALMADGIDFYPEYTGTGLLVLLQPDPAKLAEVMSDPNKTYDFVRAEFRTRFGLEWLRPIGFNNAYALMMRKEQAGQLQIRSITDLKKYLDSDL